MFVSNSVCPAQDFTTASWAQIWKRLVPIFGEIWPQALSADVLSSERLCKFFTVFGEAVNVASVFMVTMQLGHESVATHTRIESRERGFACNLLAGDLRQLPPPRTVFPGVMVHWEPSATSPFAKAWRVALCKGAWKKFTEDAG